MVKFIIIEEERTRKNKFGKFFLSLLLISLFVITIGFVSAWNFPSTSASTTIVNFSINGTEVLHNSLADLQGGTPGEYYHIRASWYNELNSDIFNWITWTEAMNGTLLIWIYLGQKQWNATIFLASQWNATNESYMTGSNFTLQNISLNNYINFQNTSQTNYISSNNASVNNYINEQNTSQTNYINDNNQSVTNAILAITVGGEVLWNANYSTFLTHITWAEAMNGTLFKTSQWNATNLSYLEIKNWNATNTSYLTAETLWNANYSQFLLNNVSISNALNTKLDITQWNATNTSYLEIKNWNATNTSYYLVTNPFGFYNSTSNIGNWTNDKGTYTLLSVLNNGSYLNYAWNSTNESYMTGANFTLQNTSMVNYIAVQNQSLVNYIAGVNTSQTNYGNQQNTSVTNSISNISTFFIAQNGSLVNYIAVQNQSIVNYILLQNNSLVNYFATQNTSMKNYVIDYVGIQNTSLNNYIGVQNGSLVNYFAVQNTSMKNYVNSVGARWDANYSVFLTHITWAEAMNGTLFKTSQWNATNLSYVPYTGATQNVNLGNANLTVNNVTATGYLMGQPLLGMMGSGLINSTQTNSLSEVNVTCSGLNCSYNAFEVRLVSGTSNQFATYCKIPAGSQLAPDNTHSVFYVDSACAIQTTTIDNWFGGTIQTGGLWDFANMVCYNGACEVSNGIGLEQRRMMKQRVLDYNEMHLNVVSGLDIQINTFPGFNITLGKYVYLMDVVTTSAVNANQTDTLEYIYHNSSMASGWTARDTSGIQLTQCDNTTDLVTCTGNQWRRYYIYMIGWNETGKTSSGVHQTAALLGTTYSSLANCLNTVTNPLVFNLPSWYVTSAVPLYAYCARRTDTNTQWLSSNFIDLRTVKTGTASLSALETDPVWTAEKVDYTLLSVLNNGSYLNYAWNATNESYMTGANFTLQNISMQNYIGVQNGSIVNYIAVVNTSMKNYVIDYVGIQNTSMNNYIGVQNGSLVNYFAVQNTSMKNYVIDYVATQNTSLVNYIKVQNDSLVNYITVQNGSLVNYIAVVNTSQTNSVTANNASVNNYIATKLSISQWNATNTSYMTFANWNATNSSYLTAETLWNANYSTFLTHVTWAQVQNGTMVKSTELNNGTYVTNLVLNNGTYLNTDTFVANYSTLLTKITWAEVMNGTMVKSTELNNGTYVTNLILNNGSYSNLNWNNNYSTFLTHITWANVMNGTLAKSSELNNGTYVTNLVLNNGTYVTNLILNNGSYSNLNWNNNYSTFLTLMTMANATTQNTSLVNYIKVQNDSLVNYILLQNNSLVNYFATQNTSMKNYVIDTNNTLATWVTAQNTSQTNALATKLALAGGTMTGQLQMNANINMSANQNLSFNGNANRIWSNTTCLYLKGSTVNMWLC